MRNLYQLMMVIFLGLGGLSLQAQDAHFSQYEQLDQYNNPAVGLDVEGIRIGGIYRSQWVGIGNAFTTYGAQFQQRIKNIGWGITFHQNQAGQASLKRTGASLTANYRKQLGAGANFLNIGAGLGFTQANFDVTSFTFDDQYVEGQGYDASQGNGEGFLNSQMMRPDFQIGATWQGEIGKWSPSLGISFAHLNQPDWSFNDELWTLPVTSRVNAALAYQYSSKLVIRPHVLIAKQGTATEQILGVDASYKVTKKTEATAGLAFRNKDAVILKAGVIQDRYEFGLSYDVTVSKMSGNGGALELYASCLLGKVKRKVIQPVEVMPEAPEKETVKNELDSDGDGILDRVDQCPNLAGVLENRGCPMATVDSDKDGIPDNEDFCPYLKGLPAFKGCPDSDKDGISDIEDKCPFLKGVVENMGCPPVSNNKLKEFFMPKVIVEFDTDKHDIKNRYFNRLDAMAAQLVENPELRIKISGHTDGEGDAEYNFQLGQRRANEVRHYFEEWGIAIDRLEIISFGETKPVTDNTSDEGKARNRRVEVWVNGN